MHHSPIPQVRKATTRTFNPAVPDFIECSCGGEGVAVALDEVAPFDVTLSFWSMSLTGKKIGFIDRIRFCWKILFTGTLWTDMVCISQQNISRLVSSLLKRRIA